MSFVQSHTDELCMLIYACVCVWERESEPERYSKRENVRERERERMRCQLRPKQLNHNQDINPRATCLRPLLTLNYWSHHGEYPANTSVWAEAIYSWPQPFKWLSTHYYCKHMPLPLPPSHPTFHSVYIYLYFVMYHTLSLLYEMRVRRLLLAILC